MIHKLMTFIKSYKHFTVVALAMLIALGLDIAEQDRYAHILLTITALASLIPLLRGMWHTVRDGQYGLDVLAITAIVSAVLFKEYWTAMIIVLMLTGGEALEDYAETRAKVELSSLLDKEPTRAHLVKGKTVTDVSVKQIQIGDRVLVKPGEVIPVDGEIIENGITSVDESSITGESLPITKEAGDIVLSGSVNLDGAITLKVIHSAQDSQYQQIVKLVQGAVHSQAPFVRMADRYAIPFTALAFTIAGLAWALSGDSLRFLQVLVVATPCPLLLGAPIAMISGMSRAAKHGVIAKNGAALEKLAASKTIAFDKTGTLTQGKPTVQEVRTFNGYKKDDVLALAAALEQSSNHVLAVAITNAAMQAKISVPKIKHIKEFTGGGLQATAKQGVIRIGTQRFLQEQGVEFADNSVDHAHTASYVAVDDTVIGVITFVDEPRDNAKATLQRLKNLGINHLLMVTGDNSKTANAIGKKLGITDVRANCLPADKIIAIQGLPNQPVAFVGDGVNDAPALTAASVGIALGARGSTAASQTADIIIMQDDISRVADAADISKRTMFIARQSIWIGISLSVGLMFIFATGKFKPSTGAAVQELVDVAVILNALRAHSGKLRG